MQMHLRKAALAAALALAGPLAGATVLTFDDIGADGAVPLNYGGLDWSAAGWSVFAGEQEPYTAHSGSFRAATNWGVDDAASEVRFAKPTVFDGAWFAGLGGATVRFDLYLGGQLVASSATLDPDATPRFLASGWSGAVDAVRVSSPWHASYVMDDFSFQGAPVPEPQTVLMLAAGLALLQLALRRRRPD